jgi:antitoxin component YwqK of YwqJK toxin-antitoxin module
MQEQSNVSVFVHTPKLYSLLYYFNNEKQRKNIQKNKELIVSFVRIAFQMTSNGEFFKTTLLAEHDINALYDDDMEQFQAAAEDVFLKRIDSLQFKIEFKKKETPKDGPFVLYYQEEELLKDSIVQHKGRIEDGKINGFCRSYYESGNLYCVVEYEDSKLNGRSIFYYDNPEQNMLAIIFFKDNLIVDAYKEFYSNGKIKALIEFKKGLPHGDVEFYYERGALKLSGKYKKGLKAGKWKYYTETGEPYKKTKHKDGRIVE